MDNSIVATISFAHMFLGFLSGIAFANILHAADKYRLHRALEKAMDEKFKQDLHVDELVDRIGYLEERTGELEDAVCRATSVLKSTLPPPSRNEDGHLDRETQCIVEECEFTLHSNMEQTPK